MVFACAVILRGRRGGLRGQSRLLEDGEGIRNRVEKRVLKPAVVQGHQEKKGGRQRLKLGRGGSRPRN